MTSEPSPSREAARLAAVSYYQILDTPPEPEFDNIARVAAQICETPAAIICLVDRSRQWFKSHIGLDIGETSLDDSVCKYAIQQDDVFIVPNLTADARFSQSQLVVGEPYLKSYAGVPLKSRDGLAIGTVAVLDHTTRDFSEAQCEALLMLADQVMVLLELSVARRRLARGAKRLPEKFCALDHEFRFTFVSQDAAAILGSTPDDLVGRIFWEDCTAGDSGPLAEELRQADAAGGPTNFEIFYNPSSCWIDVVAHPTVDGLTLHLRDVTVPRSGQQQLKLLEAAVSHINDAVLITQAEPFSDPGPRVVFANNAFRRMTGYDITEIIGKTPRILQGEKTQRGTLDAIQSALKARRPIRVELINYKKSGEEFWLELDVTPITDDAGWHTHFVAVERDITSRKRAELLRDSETRILQLISLNASLPETLDQIALACDLVLTGSRASILLLDSDGRHIRHGASIDLPPDLVRAIYGVEIGSSVGSCETAMYQREIRIVEDIETDPLWKDYREVALSHGLRACWSIPVISSKGSVIGSFAIFWPEPRGPSSEHLQSIERLAQLAALAIEGSLKQRALHESEQRLRQLAETIDEMFWFSSYDGAEVYFVSSGYESIWGRPCEELFRNPQKWFDAIHDDDKPGVNSNRHDFQSGPYSTEYRIIRPDGQVRWVLDKSFPILDESGEITGIVGIARDISERKEAEVRLQRSQRLEAVGQLTGGVAHDFNNLLQVILGAAEFLEDGLKEDEELRSAAEMARFAAEQGASLTKSLLAFSRRQPLQAKSTDINKLVARMDNLLRRTLGGQIEIGIAIRGGVWNALVDGAQFENALLNLAINARDAMPDGGKLQIEIANVHLDESNALPVEDFSCGDYVLVQISDNGTGMDEHTLAHACDPFFTTKEIGEGSGLGLSMVYGFIKQSKGQLLIESELGRGTKVRLYIPRASDFQEGLEIAAVNTASLPGIGRILLVEDNTQLRSQVLAQLQAIGYQVTAARDAHEALELLKQSDEYDLLFTDIMMPGGLNGYQLGVEARRIRTGLPILFTTGFDQGGANDRTGLTGRIYMLPKPYRRQDLATKVRAAIKESDG